MRASMDSMQQLAWWQSEVARYRYKPDWELTVQAVDTVSDVAQIVLRVTTLVPDSRDPERTILIGHGQLIPTYFTGDERFAQHFITNMIRTMEDHERGEWLARDGQLVDDPHKHDKKKEDTGVPEV